MAKIGYARVSTRGQNDDSQVDDLTACGCEKIFTDTASGKHAARPELDKALAYLRKATSSSSPGCPAPCGPSSTCSPSPTSCASAASAHPPLL